MSGHGILFVVSAPSGGGKGSILNEVLANDPDMEYSVSVTTRQPRPNEIKGESYAFVSVDEFRRGIDDGEFVEWAEVHDNYYGTPRKTLEEKLASGYDIALDLDVQGMRLVKKSGLKMVSVFLVPPSMAILEDRLEKRGDLTEEEIRLRLRNAENELAAKDEFDHVIVNDVLDDAVSKFREIVRSARDTAQKS